MSLTFADLCAAGGGVGCGARAAGLRPIFAVECDPKAAAVYVDNHGDHVTIERVERAKPKKHERPDIMWASPSCKNASVANNGAVETAEDLATAEGICAFLKALKPRGFILENVPKYRHFRSFHLVVDTLTELGYWPMWSLLNAADFGVPQTRKRLILRALLHGMPPPLPPAVAWRGWYQAIEDLLPTLPESKFADWQLQRLPDVLQSALVNVRNQGQARGRLHRTANEPCMTVLGEPGIRGFLAAVQGENSDIRTAEQPSPPVTAAHGAAKYRAFLVQSKNTGQEWGDGLRGACEGLPSVQTVMAGSHAPRALLVDGQNASSRDGIPTLRDGNDPAFTISNQAKGYSRAWLSEGRVVAMTPRALARFQTVPDWYRLPDVRTLACQIVGNMVPPLWAEIILRSMAEALA